VITTLSAHESKVGEQQKSHISGAIGSAVNLGLNLYQLTSLSGIASKTGKTLMGISSAINGASIAVHVGGIIFTTSELNDLRDGLQKANTNLTQVKSMIQVIDKISTLAKQI